MLDMIARAGRRSERWRDDANNHQLMMQNNLGMLEEDNGTSLQSCGKLNLA
jgi:hypothetical protein